MGSAFQSFRELIPFTLAFAGQPVSDRIRSRLGEISKQPAEKALPLLTTHIVPAIATQSNLQMRFKLLEDVLREAERTLPVLEQTLKKTALPLPKNVLSSALQTDNLIKALASAYYEIVLEIAGRNENVALAHLMHRAALQAMRLIARRQKFAYLACTRPSPSSWRMLHDLYRILSAARAIVADDDFAAIKHQYLTQLLTAYLEPNKLPRGDLGALHNCANQLAHYALISPANSLPTPHHATAPRFLVQTEKGSPGHKLISNPETGSDVSSLIIDCSAIVSVISEQVSARRSKVTKPQIEGSSAFLQTLLMILSGKATRQFSRTRFRPHADLVVGLDAVISFIEETACTRRSVDIILREERPVATSVWSLIDESPNGFLLRFMKGNQWQAGAGDVVAIQPRESSKVHVCMVRRVSSRNGQLELGLQLLSPQVSIIELPTGSTRSQRAIYFHNLPAHDQSAGIIARPGQLKSKEKIVFKAAGKVVQRKIGKCIEANEGLEFVTLTPLPD
jgi:hypothetical protein